jgi:hypothetical protein
MARRSVGRRFKPQRAQRGDGLAAHDDLTVAAGLGLHRGEKGAVRTDQEEDDRCRNAGGHASAQTSLIPE